MHADTHVGKHMCEQHTVPTAPGGHTSECVSECFVYMHAACPSVRLFACMCTCLCVCVSVCVRASMRSGGSLIMPCLHTTRIVDAKSSTLP